jgi:HSP20 family molecular chaperone IbpA
MSNDLADQFSRILTSILTQPPGTSLGSLVPTGSTSRSIKIDIVNEENTIFVYAELPGVNKEDIEVDFYNNKLTISAEKKRTYASPEISEIKYGKYERILTLPICITARETVIVTHDNGVLKIQINKLIEERNRFSVRP